MEPKYAQKVIMQLIHDYLITFHVYRPPFFVTYHLVTVVELLGLL